MLSLIQEHLSQYYIYIKFVHVLFVMMWSFSALGATWYLYVTFQERKKDPENEILILRDEWARYHFLNVAILEHISFPIVILTGAVLFVTGGWSTESMWLFIKLCIVIGIYIPIEIADTFLSHFYYPKIMRNKENDRKRFDQVIWFMDKTLPPGGTLVMLLVPVVVFLAIVKPAI